MRGILFSIILVLLLTFALTNTGYAYNAYDKLARGTLNFLVSPLELFQGISDSYKEYDPAVALPVGILKGSWNTMVRAGVGLYEIITFPFPIPVEYAPIIKEPRFFKD